jgi:NAD(P)-dependent dehydrogenase (short-subunit alcohol dehydrogenase family)
MRNHHAVVTGGNSGIGLETVKQLARVGATVTMAVRDMDRGRAARQKIWDEIGLVEIDVRLLDLASLESIRDFAGPVATAPLDILINNAGVMAIPYAQTVDGFEMQFGVNHIGHFALTAHLWSALRLSQNPRVVTVASNAHKPGKIDFGQLPNMPHYSRAAAYSQSKLANLLFAFELQRRTDNAGLRNFKSIACHPGYTATNLSTGTISSLASPLKKIWRSIENAIAQPAEMGALPTLYAATAVEVPGGAYVGPDGWGEWRGHPKLVTPSPLARDHEIAEKLWRMTEEFTGIVFPL